MMTREEKIIDKFEQEMERDGNYLLLHDYFVVGFEYGEEAIDEGLAEAMLAFIRRYHYGENIIDLLLNSIIAREAYYKMMEREGLLTYPPEA